jgi:hypothetical protein
LPAATASIGTLLVPIVGVLAALPWRCGHSLPMAPQRWLNLLGCGRADRLQLAGTEITPGNSIPDPDHRSFNQQPRCVGYQATG